MKTDKINVIILAILMLTFTVVIDLYVFSETQALDYLEAFMILFLNFATMGIVYISYLFLTSNQSKTQRL